MCVYIHISNHVQTVHELPLVPNNSAREKLYNKLETVRSVDSIFITAVTAWQWLGEYVTLDKVFYSLLFKQTAPAAAPSYFQIFFLIAFLEEAFISNIIIILVINQTM